MSSVNKFIIRPGSRLFSILDQSSILNHPRVPRVKFIDSALFAYAKQGKREPNVLPRVRSTDSPRCPATAR